MSILEKPKYPSLEACLRSLKQHCSELGVNQWAMQTIKCGLDQLAWP